jgi:hypothetical protein
MSEPDDLLSTLIKMGEELLAELDTAIFDEIVEHLELEED